MEKVVLPEVSVVQRFALTATVVILLVAVIVTGVMLLVRLELVRMLILTVQVTVMYA